jgi:hypothetical protein
MTSSPSQHYRANTPKVIFEAFDDETILINLDSGNYYSFGGTGALLWDLITSGQLLRDTVAALQTRFPNANAVVERAVHKFVDELITEGLITERDDKASNTAGELKAMQEIHLPEFEKPTIVKYSDMAELLLLDPIHEVDEGGWPRAITTDSSAESAE